MTFRKFVYEFLHFESPFGDFARDVAQDATFPISNDKEDILNYLTYEKNADKIVIEVFKEMIAAYEIIMR